MKKGLPVEATVGIFVLAGLILLIMGTVVIGKFTPIGYKGSYRIYAKLTTALGIEKDAKVTMAGVRIGRVEGISLEGKDVILTIFIEDGRYKIPRDSVASAKIQGLLGEWFIDITPGSDSKGFLKDGDYIERVEPPRDFTEVINNLSSMIKTLEDVAKSLQSFFSEL